MAGVTVPIAAADIYFWTDENGVKNFTNYSPPEKAEVFMETSEADENTELNEAETNRAGDTDRELESEQLQAAAEEIEALREQVSELKNDLKDRLEALPEASPMESDDVATETEEQPRRFDTGAAMCIGRIRTATPHTGTRGIASFALVTVTVGRDTKNSLTIPTGLKYTSTGRQPSRSGHGSLGPRPGYRSSGKGAYYTGSGRQRHMLGRQPGFAGGNSRR